ncbi:hypothetical protein [Listeria ivanovii]|uniref:PH domain-containing protein n=2 Tax=Listeria ivanovii TaxID=1638 RepID=A0ABS1G663_LISIV|nr:hypothetical protein [Listeria ivanovii]EFR96603.1 conserved hypothetical protein [Listeria ivanovii FSL F6-596]AIS60154.1 hypothetical protein JL58_09290 [Listeria ivanovii subsp. londoniensis]MBC2256223.1 hypothetical protein [Listeria ivanovii]MBK1962369.1 hypothetical protein [Listeria ivanovii subsp. londoniensis]MBK2003737.1 hypothetical protein [Listeria ivanovii subsp. londoniensis]
MIEVDEEKKTEKIDFGVNHRLIFSSCLLWIAVGILLYLIFSHIKGINEIEEIILLIFIGLCILRPLFRLFNTAPTVELTERGIAYRGDFKSWNEVKETELKKPTIKLFSQGRLKIMTSINGRTEMAWDIVAADVSISLEELEALILSLRDRYANDETVGAETFTDKKKF